MLKEGLKCVALFLAALLFISLKSSAGGQSDKAPDIQLLADAYGISYSLANQYQDAMVMLHEAHKEDVDDELVNLYDLLYKVIQLNLRMHTAEKNFKVTRGKVRNWQARHRTKAAPPLSAHREELEEVLQEIRYVGRFWRIMFESHISKPAQEFCLNRNEIDLCNQLFDHTMVLFWVTLSGNERLIQAYERTARYP